jgi:hypothetical protein
MIMTIHTPFNSSLEQRFAALSDARKAAQWVSFIDAIDAGEMGWHPYYEVLAPMYATDVSPFDQEPLEAKELDIFSIEGGVYLEALELQSAA